MYIYKITNTLNNKVYIGQSIRKVQERFRRHINDAINCKLDTHFARAIRFHGADKFQIEIIATTDNQDELNFLEQKYIQEYNSVNDGYNETDAIYKCGGNTYKSKNENEMNEICAKIAKTKIGKLNPNSRSVKCMNIKTREFITFDTIKECQDYFKEKHHRFITTRITRQTRSLYKGEWAIAYSDDDFKYETTVRRRQTVCKVTDHLNEKVLICGSLREIQDVTGIKRNKISLQFNRGNSCFDIDEFTIELLDKSVTTNG